MAAVVYGGIFLGSFLFKYLSKKKELRIDWLTILVGTVVMNLLLLIPFVGCLIVGVVWLSVFGTLFDLGYRRFQRER